MANKPLSLTRRDWLRLTTAGALGLGASGWLPALAEDLARHPERRRACILLWMNGGPSQIDTFDPKPDHANGGQLKAIETAVPGIRIGELLPKVAQQMKHLAVIRSVSTKEGDHSRATYLLRTGYVPQEPIQYPTFGSLLSKELEDPAADLPGFVSVASQRGVSDAGFSAGFLGARHAPLLVGNFDTDPYTLNPGESALAVPDLKPPAFVESTDAQARLKLLQQVEGDFALRHDSMATQGTRAAFERAIRLMQSQAASAFDLRQEPARLRETYGRNLFGQGCLLARRLVERGVPFVEVFLGRIPGAYSGWDTHSAIYDSLKALCGVLDPAWATLLTDLKDRGLLDTTLVAWMGEFGRTPRINPGVGRDHYPNAWSVVLGGGGIKGGQVFGRTSKDGSTVEEKPVRVPDLLATVCKAMGVDPLKQNRSNIGRPIRIVHKDGTPLKEVLA
jgi:uncharacterized protein (DUF1501 family)